MRLLRLLTLSVIVVVGLLVVPVDVARAATTTPTGASGTTAPGSGPWTSWLCLPWVSPDPCTPDLTTTRVSFTSGTLGVTRAAVAAHPKIDCFYVYPTVSDQKTGNATLAVDSQEVSIAEFQGAQFSRVCRMYAPVYRQLTIAGISGTPGDAALAYGDVLHAWLTYLHRYNHGRGVVLIGHSQGAIWLRRLITAQVDPHPAVRRLLVSAVLLGGNVLVRTGTGPGGDFHSITACRSASQTGCVIAYSTFDQTPPASAVFGRTATRGLQVLCTNPAALGGGTGPLDPILPTRPFSPGSSVAAGIAALRFSVPQVDTPWVSAPGAYLAHCSASGGSDVLQLVPTAGAPTLHPSPNADWGLHLVDVNIALGNLVGIVGRESAAYHPAR